MSEPYAVLAQVTIERAALIAYLAAQPPTASQWDDWSRIGGLWRGFSWEADLPPVLVRVDKRLGASYRHAVRTVLEASDAPALGRCCYDEASRRFTFGTLTFSINLNEIIFFFAAARGLATYMRGAEAGFALVRNYLWDNGNGTVAVISIGADGYSHFLDAQDDAPAHEQHVRDATAVFDEIYQGYAKLGRFEIFGKLSPAAPDKPGPSSLDDLERLR